MGRGWLFVEAVKQDLFGGRRIGIGNYRRQEQHVGADRLAFFNIDFAYARRRARPGRAGICQAGIPCIGVRQFPGDDETDAKPVRKRNCSRRYCTLLHALFAIPGSGTLLAEAGYRFGELCGAEFDPESWRAIRCDWKPHDPFQIVMLGQSSVVLRVTLELGLFRRRQATWYDTLYCRECYGHHVYVCCLITDVTS